jgi:hypothetical protein
MLAAISFGLDIAAVFFTALYLVQLSGHLIRAESEDIRWSSMRGGRGMLPAILHSRKRI